MERNLERKPGEFPLTSLLRDLRDEVTTLLRQEIALAKAEISEKIKRLTRDIALIAVGGILAIVAAIFLLLAVRDLLAVGLLAAGVSAGVAVWLAPLIIALAIGIAAWVMIDRGRKALAKEDLTPRKTIQSLREDQQWAKQKLAHT
jgi:hypothetical protein